MNSIVTIFMIGLEIQSVLNVNMYLTGRIFLGELTEHENSHVRMSIHIKCLF